MKLLIFCFAICLFANGCTDSVSQPSQNYPLQLSVSNYTRAPGSLREFFTLQVTKSGTAVKGAKLTVLTAPSAFLDTVMLGGVDLTSDSTGTFTFYYDWGTESSIAFQAVKDTLVSNYVRF